MNVVEAALRRLAVDLSQIGRPWAIVGGFAVSARAEPRFTRDVDVAVAVADDSEAELLVRDLLGAGYHLSASVEQEATGRLATARLVSMPVRAAEQVIVDVLFASSGIEPEIVAAADTIEIIPELTLPVATIGHLMALKVLARDDETRPQDLADLRALLSVATHEDVDQARSAVRLITKRGFHRNRDLAGALDELVR